MTITEKVTRLLQANPGVYTRPDVCDILGIKILSLYSIIHNRPELAKLCKGRGGKMPKPGTKMNLIASFVKSNPNRYTRDEIAKELGLPRSLVVSTLCTYRNLSKLVIKTERDIHLQIIGLIFNHPNEYSRVEIANKLRIAYDTVIKCLSANKYLKNMVEIRVPKTPLRGYNDVIEFVLENPNMYTSKEIAEKVGVHTATVSRAYRVMPELRDLTVILTKERSEIADFIRSNPNKYTLRELEERFNMRKYGMGNYLNHHKDLAKLVITNRRKRVDPAVVAEFVKANPHKYTIAEIAEHFGMSLESVYRVNVKFPEISKLQIDMRGKVRSTESVSTRVIALITSEPNMHTKKDIARILGIDIDVVYPVIVRNPYLTDLVLESKKFKYEQIEGMRELDDTIKKFIEDNPRKYRTADIEKILGVSKFKVRRVVYANPDLVSKIIMRKTKIDRSAEITEFIKSNPFKYTLDELIVELNITRRHIKTFLSDKKELSKLIYNGSSYSKIGRFLTENPGMYTTANIAKSVKISVSGANAVVRENAEFNDRITVRSASSKKETIKQILRDNPNKYTRVEVKNLVGVHSSTVGRYSAKDAELRELLSENVTDNSSITIVTQFIKENPNKYYAIEVAKKLNISVSGVHNVLNANPELKALIINKREKSKEDAYNKLYNFLNENPNVYLKSQLVGISGLTVSRLFRVFKLHPELEDLLRKESLHDRIEEFIRSNPNKYSASEVGRRLNTSTHNIFNALKNRPELRKLLLNGRCTKR